MYRQSEKNLLSSNISSTCAHNTVNFGPLAAEICLPVWGTCSKFQQVSRLGSVTASTSLNGNQSNFAQCLAISWAGTLYRPMHFRGLLPLTGFCQVQNSLCVQILRLLYWQRYCTALERWASVKLCGVQQRAPSIFGRAAITLDILVTRYSSFCWFRASDGR